MANELNAYHEIAYTVKDFVTTNIIIDLLIKKGVITRKELNILEVKGIDFFLNAMDQNTLSDMSVIPFEEGDPAP